MKNLLLLLSILLSTSVFCITTTVTASGTSFSPSTFTITYGDSVNFNLGGNHNATEVSLATWNANGTTPLGGGFATATGGGIVTPVTLTVGTHYFVCTPHASMGMKGTVVVQNCTIPTTPGVISGNKSICSASQNTYSVTAVSGATSYSWTLPGGWTGTSLTNIITTTASATSGTISVTADNICGASAVQTVSVSVNTIPASPGGISGNVTVCLSSSNTYSITTVSGATSYSWTLPGGWTGSSTINSIFTTASTLSGNVSVTANNTCGSSAAQTLSVTVNTPPSGPGVISGNTSTCSAGSNTYSVTAVSGATGYSWTLPNGWTGNSTTNSISTTASNTSGTVTVSASNGCGSSTVQTLQVTVDTLPPSIGIINGEDTVCQLSLNTYSVTGTTGASSYTWSTPSGWSGSSMTNSISVVTGSVSGIMTVSVMANNPCGISTTQTFTVMVSSNVALSQPGAISGNISICPNSTNTYSITAMGGATSYTWSLPGGWSGTSATNIISTVADITSGDVFVSAVNGCGASAPQTLSVTVNVVDTSLAQNGTMLTANAAGATYQWINCIGNTPINGETNQIYTATVNGNYAVVVTHNGCSDTSSCYTVNNVGITESNESFVISIHPNPSNGNFQLVIENLTHNQKYNMEIFNALGKKVYQTAITNAKSDINLNDNAKGIYFIKLYTGQSVVSRRVVIE